LDQKKKKIVQNEGAIPEIASEAQSLCQAGVFGPKKTFIAIAATVI
jgi:hypothetical protein